MLYEIIGYIASGLVAVSLMMSSLLRLRLINLVGAICFTAYGLLIGAYPVAAVNAFIIVINSYYLYQMLRSREYFTLLEVLKGSRFLHYFLNFHQAEIAAFFPGFMYKETEEQLAFFVLRDMVPTGLFIAQPAGEGIARILLDYVAPGYRDLQVARFVYREHAHLFREKGIHRLVAEAATPKHARYLERMGFRAGDDTAKTYTLNVH